MNRLKLFPALVVLSLASTASASAAAVIEHEVRCLAILEFAPKALDADAEALRQRLSDKYGSDTLSAGDRAQVGKIRTDMGSRLKAMEANVTNPEEGKGFQASLAKGVERCLTGKP